MTSDFLGSPLFLVGAVLALVGVLVVLAGLAALVRRRPFRFLVRVLFGALLATAGALLVAVGLGMAGYSALTHEALAATIDVQPIAPQRFRAVVRRPDGVENAFELAGDELYMDAHVLKWKPMANVLGLHTAYELDRIGGRYRSIGDERNRSRTVEQLAPERPIDLFALRRRYVALAPLLDAEYGSASFVAVDRPARLELRVSTSGLLLREAPVR